MLPTTLFVAGSIMVTSSPALFVWRMRTLAAESGKATARGNESSNARDLLMAGKPP
jgi:hypothetical protein